MSQGPQLQVSGGHFPQGTAGKTIKRKVKDIYSVTGERESGMREKKIIGHRVRSREREKRTERTK